MLMTNVTPVSINNFGYDAQKRTLTASLYELPRWVRPGDKTILVAGHMRTITFKLAGRISSPMDVFDTLAYEYSAMVNGKPMYLVINTAD